MKLNDIPECERCCGVDIDKLESDLKTAHEVIREFRKELEFYGDKKNWYELVEGEHKICGTFKVVKYWTDCGYEYDIDGVADEGKRARAVLQKWQGKL